MANTDSKNIDTLNSPDANREPADMDAISKVDAVIIGSGAAGSVMAYQLARKGLKVAVIEKGKRENPRTFEHNEAKMLPRLYKKGGLQTSSDNNISFMQGATVGGSTVINNAIWLPADLNRILPDWEQAGATVPKEALQSAYEEIASNLKVSLITGKLANPSSRVFRDGGNRLESGSSALLHNNRHECIGCGFCNFGCRYNRKTSMLVTYIPWSEARGVVFLDCCHDAQVVTKGKQATGVKFVRNNKEEFIASERVIVSAGGIGSSAVLLGSGIHLNGRVGKGFHALTSIFAMAEVEEKVDGYDGIGLTSTSRFSEEYVVEDFFSPPLTFAIALEGYFMDHFQRMLRYSHFSQAGVLVGTDPTGVISLDKKKRTKINLKLSDRDISRLKKGLDHLSRAYFDAGAVKVLPGTFRDVEFANVSDLQRIDAYINRPDDLILSSSHPQGGNPMHESPGKGVVDNGFKVHGYENLFVADTSVFPTNIWVNCQATAMAMSHYASGFVAK